MPKSNTASHILDVAQDLIQKRGYHAISFNDIAIEVGIKKPSVIHHFSSKPVLGVAVVNRYRQHFSSQLEALFKQSDVKPLEMFDAYCVPYLDFGKSGDKICLCGALAGEFMALPEEVSIEVKNFFNEHMVWIEKILQCGLKDGSYSFQEEPKELAAHVLNALQGALMIKRATGEGKHLQTTIVQLKARFTS